MPSNDSCGTETDRMLVSCPECGTETMADSGERAVEIVEDHNEQRHDGEQVAGLGPGAMSLPTFSDSEKEQIREAVEALKDAE